MKKIRYLIEYLIIKVLFFIFKIIGYQKSSNLGNKIGILFGPLFRNKVTISKNLGLSGIKINENQKKKLIDSMWGNYGRIFAEYPFLKDFKNSKLEDYISIEGEEVLEDLKRNNKISVFVSGHFNNFELMSMYLVKKGVNLAAIYRPLNNFFLNNTMESIRKNYICENQIKKGLSGTREVIKFIKKGNSIALMIDQRVTEGIKCNFFNQEAFTTTIPGQLAIKYDLEIVPVYIERYNNFYFKMKIYPPLNFTKEKSIKSITERLNSFLEDLIRKNPDQWIWTHNRWK